MIIKLYKITNVSKKINKTLPDTPTLSLTGNLKNDCDFLNPVIEIENTGVPDVNYAYIEEFSRYYFVEPPVNTGAKLWQLKMHVDVLYTYSASIMAAPCIVAKSSSSYNLYLNDANYKCYQNPHIFSYEFPAGFDVSQAHFVMTLFGTYVVGT